MSENNISEFEHKEGYKIGDVVFKDDILVGDEVDIKGWSNQRHFKAKGRGVQYAERAAGGPRSDFSPGWIVSLGLVDPIASMPLTGPASNLSEVLANVVRRGPDVYTQNRVDAAAGLAPNPDAGDALRNVILPLLILGRDQETGRLKPVIEELKSKTCEYLTPYAIGEFLKMNQEVRFSFGCVMTLMGYTVAPEAGFNYTIAPILGAINFKDLNPRDTEPDPVDPKIMVRRDPSLDFASREAYLTAIANRVGTDTGVVRIAYEIARLCKPHMNGGVLSFQGAVDREMNPAKKLSGVGESTLRASRGLLENPINTRAEDHRNPTLDQTLVNSLRTGGGVGFADALASLRPVEITTWWDRALIMWDALDTLSNIRSAKPPYDLMSHAERCRKADDLFGAKDGPIDKGIITKEDARALSSSKYISGEKPRGGGLVSLPREKEAVGRLAKSLFGFK